MIVITENHIKIITKKSIYRFNRNVIFRNFVVLSTIISAGMLAHKITNEGISWMSTIGYFD